MGNAITYICIPRIYERNLKKKKKRALSIYKEKVSQINTSDNNNHLSESFNESFDYGYFLR